MAEATKEIIQEFKQAINMTPKELEAWLKTEQSQQVGQKKDSDDEAIGHKSGRHIIELLQMKQAEYDEDDLSHMKKVVSYIHRHSAQRPSGDVENTRWRYSLMNGGTIL
jgi:DNA topoisomerase VI subunit B